MTKDTLSSPASVPDSFQSRVLPWLLACFGAEISADKLERNHRFFEEATEVVQAGGMTRSEAHQLVDYTYDRPAGELHQEVGGAMNTLAALCLAHGIDMHEAAEVELARVWTKMAAIRAKHAAKPKHSPLPVSVPERDAMATQAEDARREAEIRLSTVTARDWYGDRTEGPLTFLRRLLDQERAKSEGLRTALVKAREFIVRGRRMQWSDPSSAETRRPIPEIDAALARLDASQADTTVKGETL